MSDRTMDDGRQHWSLDRRVPVALIVALVGQAGVGLWQFAVLHSTVGFQDRRIASLEAMRADDQRASLALRDAVAEMRSTNGELARAVARLEAALDRIAPRSPYPQQRSEVP